MTLSTFIRKYQNNLFGIILIPTVAYIIFSGIKQDLGNQSAAEHGVYIKAYPTSHTFTSTIYNTEVSYKYKGKLYHGTVSSKCNIDYDSVLIKILPSKPEFLNLPHGDSLNCP